MSADLWWHLLDDHGIGAGMVHGDPGLMHATLHAGITETDHDHDHDEDR